MIRSEFYWRRGSGMISVVRDGADLRTTLPLGPDLQALLNGSVSLSEGLHRCAGDALLDPLCN